MKRPRYTPVKHSSGRVVWLLLWEPDCAAPALSDVAEPLANAA